MGRGHQRPLHSASQDPWGLQNSGGLGNPSSSPGCRCGCLSFGLSFSPGHPGRQGNPSSWSLSQCSLLCDPTEALVRAWDRRSLQIRPEQRGYPQEVGGRGDQRTQSFLRPVRAHPPSFNLYMFSFQKKPCSLLAFFPDLRSHWNLEKTSQNPLYRVRQDLRKRSNNQLLS